VFRSLAIALVAAGCATAGSGERDLQARLARLEDRVAQLEAKRAQAPVASAGGGDARCERVLDASIPAGTTFPHLVPYELGKTRLSDGDQITISEVRGTRPQFEQGGIYLVKGSYVLASGDEGTIAFTVTSARPREGCTRNNDRGHQKVKRGTGTFELAVPLQYLGYPHVYFNVVDKGAAGVYLGAGDFLLK
jgi:hypothetical protein